MSDHQAIVEMIDILWWTVTGSALIFCIPGIVALCIVALWFALRGPRIK